MGGYGHGDIPAESKSEILTHIGGYILGTLEKIIPFRSALSNVVGVEERTKEYGFDIPAPVVAVREDDEDHPDTDDKSDSDEDDINIVVAPKRKKNLFPKILFPKRGKLITGKYYNIGSAVATVDEPDIADKTESDEDDDITVI